MSIAVYKCCGLVFLGRKRGMANSQQDKVKIRFKFRSGEEFEAEGNPDFIEKQRADFLQLIGKDSPRTTQRTLPVATAESVSQTPANTVAAATNVETTLPSSVETASLSSTEPALFRRKYSVQNSNYSTSGLTREISSNPLQHITNSSANISMQRRNSFKAIFSEEEIRLWETLVKTSDQLVILRRKSRSLSSETAALLLLASAKILLETPDGYSALSLSKSLKKSGYGGGRLDRVLGGELRKGTVLCEGSKRSRLYSLSDEGFARAYSLAVKLAAEWQG